MNVPNELSRAVIQAAARPEIAAAVAAVYDAVERAIQARKPICLVSGRCCRFEEYGHRLFVTTLELAAFVRELRGPAPTSSFNSPKAPHEHAESCPFQHNKLCSVHAFRPFGCRIFFCDATAAQWQNEQYEIFHRRLKDLHAELDVPYFYVEWRQALAALII